ncbi:MAG: DUF3298 domain-containing protein [Caulobacteraceae bacterium]
MRPLILTVLVASLAAAGLAGCGDAKTPPTASTVAPKPDLPLSFEQKSADAEVKLTLAPQIADWPVLHKKLYTDAVAQLRKFAAEAPQLRADNASGGVTSPPVGQEVSWSVAAANPRLVSLLAVNYEDTGGAHPNHGYDAMLWDAVQQIEIKKDELFRPRGPADDAVKAALCDGIHKARAEKGVEESPEVQEGWPCPDWRDPDITLSPSTTPGKFGGVTFVFSPYEIGSYAEGEYEVTLPQSVLQPVLNPVWAGEFAGEPKTVIKPRE